MKNRVIQILDLFVILLYVSPIFLALGSSFATIILVVAFGLSFEIFPTTRLFIQMFGTIIGTMIAFAVRLVLLTGGLGFKVYAKKKTSDRDKLVLLSLGDGIIIGYFMQIFPNAFHDISQLMWLWRVIDFTFSVEIFFLQLIMPIGVVSSSIMSYAIRSRWQ